MKKKKNRSDPQCKFVDLKKISKLLKRKKNVKSYANKKGFFINVILF